MCFMVLYQHLQGGSEKTTNNLRLTCFLAYIQTRDLQNTNQKYLRTAATWQKKLIIRSIYRVDNGGSKHLWNIGQFLPGYTKLNLVFIIFKHSVLTAKKTQRVSSTKNNWLMLFEEMIVYSENYMKHITTLCGQSAELLIGKASGTYSYHWVLNG
jgi:hypothetical protein